MAKIIAVIKPTKKNIKTLKARGLYSDDSEFIFKVYDALLGGSDVILSYRQDDEFSRESYFQKMNAILSLNLEF